MGSFQRAKQMLLRNKKESLAYVATLGVSTCLLFLFVNVQKDGNFLAQMESYSQEMKDVSNMIAGSLTLVIIAVCFANTFIVNAYYNQAKSEELCVYLSSGMNIVKLTKYLIVQNFILLFFAILLGFVGGCIGHIGLNVLLHWILSMEGSYITLHWEGILLWLVILSIELVFLVLTNAGYAYKAELKDLMKQQANRGIDRIRKPKISPMFYKVIAVVSLVFMLFSGSTFSTVFTLLGVSCTFAYLSTGYPYAIQKKKTQRKFLSFLSLIKQGNLIELWQQFAMYAGLMMASVTGVCVISPSLQQLPYLQVLCDAAYILILIVMAISIVIKFNQLGKTRQPRFRQLQLMGAKQEQLKQIIKAEMMQFFFVFIGLPLIFGIVASVRLLLLHKLHLTLAFGILASFLICYVICFLISWNLYEKQCLIEEEYENEICD